MLRSSSLRRSQLIATALLLAFASIVPLLSIQKAEAYGLLPTRRITMSSSQLAGTDVTYEASFQVATTASIGGVVIDFCQNSPIIGDTCTAPTGFDVNEGTVAVSATGLAGFSIDAATTPSKFVYTNATAQAKTANDTITITLGSTGASDGVTNPSDLDNVTAGNQNGTFYARILTFTTDAGATGYTSTAIGSEPPLIDAGGIALSTAAQINVTAKVQERLVFCVYTGGTGFANNNCTDKAGNQINLGDNNGVLDPQKPYLDKNARYSVTTNATSGAVIRMKGATLTSGSNTINANLTPAASASGTEQFGLCNYQQAGAGLTASLDYDGGAGTECQNTVANSGTIGNATVTGADFNFNTANTTSTFGDNIASKVAGDFSTGNLAILGNISNTTEAGIYTTTLTFIATGTY